MELLLSKKAIKAIKFAISELEDDENDGWQMFLDGDEYDEIMEGIDEFKKVID